MCSPLARRVLRDKIKPIVMFSGSVAVSAGGGGLLVGCCETHSARKKGQYHERPCGNDVLQLPGSEDRDESEDEGGLAQ